jgi:hypothetical protein
MPIRFRCRPHIFVALLAQGMPSGRLSEDSTRINIVERFFEARRWKRSRT